MDNIVSVKLDSRYPSTLGVWQYDYGQVLRITGPEPPPAVEVQFSLDEKSGETLSRVGTTVDGATEVKIPDELLAHSATSDYQIYAYIYLTDETSGKTKYEIAIPVRARSKPTSPTEDPETDPDLFRETVVAVNASAERAENAASSAMESAASADETLAEIKRVTDGISEDIENANTAKSELSGMINGAGIEKKELESSIGKAGEAKTSLDSAINSAGEKRLALDATVEQANAVDKSLKEQIGSAEQIQANVEQIGKNTQAISSLNEDLDYKIGKTAVGERELKFTNIGYVNASDGTISSSQDAQNTGFCRIDGVSRIIVHVSLSEAGAKIAFYSRNKEYLKDISIIPAITDPTYTETDLDITSDVYANAKYCIISNYGSGQKIAKVIGTVAPYSAKAIAEEAKAIAEEAKAIAKKHYGTFSIIGDSYSSFKGYMANANAATWYPASDHNMNDTNDVENVEQTWWYKFANSYGCRLIENNSWSGSAISYDGYGEGLDDGKDTSFINRIGLLTKPELILVYGGTNDEWCATDTNRTDYLGDYKYSDFQEVDFVYFRPSLAYMLSELKKKHVGARIVFMINSFLNGINESVNTICEHYGIDVCEVHNIDLAHSHPTEKGMASIAEQLIFFLT